MSASELAAFVDAERACCPFLSFTIEVRPGMDAMLLGITGPEGAKAFLASELAPGDS